MNTPLSSRIIGNTSQTVSTLGLGGAPFGGLYQGIDTKNVKRAISRAQSAGITYFDTAPFYGFGLSERLMGDVLRGSDYTLSTKVGRLLEPGALNDPGAFGWPSALPFRPVFDYSYDAIMRSFEDSLQRMGLDRIDILYVHDIGEMTHGKEANDKHLSDLISGGYRALDELRASGVIKAIGLGVNENEICETMLDHGDWDVFLLAGRYTLLEQNSLNTLIPKCAAANTSLVIGGPFNSGILVGGDTWNYDTAPKEIINRVKKLEAICTDNNVPLPAPALQFPLANPTVASVIPGPRSVEELEQILDWAGFDIPESLWTDLSSSGLIHPDAPLPKGNPYNQETR